MQSKLYNLNLHVFVALSQCLEVALKLFHVFVLLLYFKQVFIICLSTVWFWFIQKSLKLGLEIWVNLLKVFNLTVWLLQQRSCLLILMSRICKFLFKLTDSFLQRLDFIFIVNCQILAINYLLVLGLNMLFELQYLLLLWLALGQDIIAQLSHLPNHLLDLLQVWELHVFGILLKCLQQIRLILVNLVLNLCIINENFIFVGFLKNKNQINTYDSFYLS